MAAGIIVAVGEAAGVLEPIVLKGIEALIRKIKAHKHPAAAVKAATAAVDATPNVSPENDPSSPYFVP